MPEKIVTTPITKKELKKPALFHPSLASGRWFTFTISEQLGNIGGEVRRAISWKEKGVSESFGQALARALELFDLTLDDGRWAGHRRREVARAREVFCDFVVGDNKYKGTSLNLQKYFDAFAIAARRQL